MKWHVQSRCRNSFVTCFRFKIFLFKILHELCFQKWTCSWSIKDGKYWMQYRKIVLFTLLIYLWHYNFETLDINFRKQVPMSLPMKPGTLPQPISFCLTDAQQRKYAWDAVRDRGVHVSPFVHLCALHLPTNPCSVSQGKNTYCINNNPFDGWIKRIIVYI